MGMVLEESVVTVALQSQGVALTSWHSRFKPVPSLPELRIPPNATRPS